MEHYSSAKLRAKYLKYYLGRATLNLDGKELSRVPAAVTELREVQGLSLCENNLTKLPTSINKLNRLKVLYLDKTILLNYLLRLVT